MHGDEDEERGRWDRLKSSIFKNLRKGPGPLSDVSIINVEFLKIFEEIFKNSMCLFWLI